MNKQKHILWADDEIDMLKSHIIYLEDKGYNVTPVHSGEDAIRLCDEKEFDVVLLDEMMVGLDGITTLKEIKSKHPAIPVIMITKNEEEWLMEEAIAAQISQYLTKPVNPSQIFIACKNILESYQIQSEHIAKDYLSSFEKISQNISEASNISDWYEIMDDLIDWSLSFDNVGDQGLGEILEEQWNDANIRFTQFVENKYSHWIKGENSPIMSFDLLSHFISPYINKDNKVVIIVMDCLRADQFQAIQTQLFDHYDIEKEYYISMLPTATPYSRNAIFSGLSPYHLQKKYSSIWKEMWNNEHSMNQHEEYLLKNYFLEQGLDTKSIHYHKIINYQEGNKFANRINEFKEVDVLALVVNFVDILGHSRSESKILQEMVPNESAYRKVICSWIENAWLMDVLKEISSWGHTVFITSDHGSTRVNKPIQIKGDRETSTGVRYKYGRNLNLPSKAGMRITNPIDYQLPDHGINTNYIIAKGSHFFVYPNEYHKFAKRYHNSFQHGGISLEEMLIPIATLKGKKK
tara:strand:- start:6 stop:1565 length:1560 start_codon:yes stop_codon:yes gene_type:complete